MAIVGGLVLVGVPDPTTTIASSGRLLTDAWRGLVYVARHPTLRGLAFTMTLINFAGGMTAIVIPVIIQGRYGAGPIQVGLAWALSGAAGGIAAFAFGRLRTEGRERAIIAWSVLLSTIGVALLLPDAGLPLVFFALAVFGLMNGPLDIGLFTIRQRRTDPGVDGPGDRGVGSAQLHGLPDRFGDHRRARDDLHRGSHLVRHRLVPARRAGRVGHDPRACRASRADRRSPRPLRWRTPRPERRDPRRR